MTLARPARLIALGVAVAMPAAARGQDTTAAKKPVRDTAGVRPPMRVDSLARLIVRPPAAGKPATSDSIGAQPPIAPRRAFLYSFLVPGLGQAALNRPNAGGLFVAIEVVGVVMARKAGFDLRQAKQFANDTIRNYVIDPATCEGADSLPPELRCLRKVGSDGESVTEVARNRYAGNRVRARRTHYEDWIAALVFNHLFAGADAFVAAQLWDVPLHASLEPINGRLGASLSLRLPFGGTGR